ncbi:hypothetical protein GGI15_001514 [Coemansia interrupta]|uniref:Uncharacterized protein n=1 Tax=Coemansia interrupta TaxID=1126814 RepID=A0A9W8HIB3_9FUNG|nr:hypothetical protein GGI15_001514 [Coemansia interrupta]
MPLWSPVAGQHIAPTPALVALSGTSKHVKALEIDLESVEVTRELAARFEEIFYTTTVIWSTVHLLQIHIRYVTPVQDAQFVPSMLIDSLARHMPNIQAISFTPRSYSSRNSEFCSQLVGRYFSRLRVLNGPTLSAAVVPRVGSTITSLDLAIDNTSELLLPKISAGRLKSLSLRCVPHTFSWKYFTEKEGDAAVWFANLENLRLEFLKRTSAIDGRREDNESTVEVQSFQVSFPRLQIIHADIWPKTECNLFSDARLSRNLRSIVSRDSIDMLAQLLPALELDALRRIHVIVLSNTDKRRFFQVTNRIFGIDMHYAYANMHIKDLGFAISAKMASWQALSILSLESMHFATMVDLIPQLSRLTQMAVRLVDLGPNVSDGQQFDPLEYLKTPTTVLSPLIDSLMIWRLKDTVPHKTAIECIKHMLRRLPALQEFHTGDRKLEDSYKLSQKPQSRLGNMRAKIRLLF